MNLRCIFSSLAACLSGILISAGAERVLQYYPDGRDIVCVNGKNRYTRALYGGYTDFRIETSDRPVFATYRNRSHRNIRFEVNVGGKTMPLELVSRCEARYNSGKREYLLSDSSWGNGKLRLTVLALPDRESGIWRFEPDGMPEDVEVTCIVCEIKNPHFQRYGDMNSDPADSFDPAPGEPGRISATWKGADGISYVVVNCGEDGSYSIDTPSGNDAGAIYDKAVRHHEWLGGNIVFDTPDPYINTLGGALTAASDGAWDGKVWLHGAIVWRMQLNGWRAAYLGDVLGMPERSRSHFTAYAASQINGIKPVIKGAALDPEKGMARAAKTWGTEMYSDGYICRYPERTDVMHHYDMNLSYIDELLWHFEYDADTAYMRRMWPVLKSHLEWEKRNWDPDDDGLYDAYCCIWASDALYYNGGAVTHSTAYNYRGFRLAAKIASLIGEDPAYYEAEADKTLRAMNESLWLDKRGHWAEYRDGMGLRRIHDHAALWSIYTPIDCGAATAAQAFRATQYVDSCIPHIPVVFAGGEKRKKKSPVLKTISTTDWLPYDWSINNVAAEEVMHTALAYFQAGRSDEGFALVKANVMDQAYLGDSPGNFGQISYYDKARGELYRDFSDNCGISARTFIQGLFGIVPNALDGKCILRPGFPSDWNHASVKTPYFSYTFTRKGDKEIYEIEQNFARPLQVILRQNTGDGGYVETCGTDETRQVIVVRRAVRKKDSAPLVTSYRTDGTRWGNNFDDVRHDRLEPVSMAGMFNSNVNDIFKNFYLTPRPSHTTLQIPVHGIGDWCHPEIMPVIDDSGLRRLVDADGILTADSLAIPFMTPAKGHNIAYTSLWDNYPEALTVPLQGSASHVYLLMAGSTNHMQSRIDNGIVEVCYTDGSSDTLPLHNPHNWCPIEQDYYEDGMAFSSAFPRPCRIDFASGKVSRRHMPMGERYGYRQRNFEKGAGIILDMPLDASKTLRTLTVRTLSNDVVIGLMALTLQR